MSLSLNMSSELLNGMRIMMSELVSNAVRHCGDKYNFDAEEALRELNVSDISVSIGSSKSKAKSLVVKEKSFAVKEKSLVVKSKYPMPFSGTVKEYCCSALRQNHGLYTQCETTVKEGEKYCNKCGPSPQYGTISERLAVGLMEFRDSKGKGPTPFTKVMKKLKISQAEVEEEAGKLNIIINPIHFEEEKVDKKEKGRPKKPKRTIELADDSTDLFAALVAKANEDDSEDESADEKLSVAESVIDTVLEKVSVTVENNEKKAEKDALKEAEKQKKEEEKQALLQKKEAEKALKEAEKQKKEEEKQALLQKKEAEKQKKEEEKQALLQKKEAEKALKEAEKEAAKQKKEAEKKPAVKSKKDTSDSETDKKKSKPAEKKVTKVVEEEEEEEDVVKRFEFEGVKYLKSKKTGIIYNMEQDVIGKWNEKTGKIDFEEAGSEEEEEEYDE